MRSSPSINPKISKDGNPSDFRSVPSSEISQALLDHYKENPSELSENRNFGFTYKYESNGVDYKLKVASSESDESESKALDRHGSPMPISIQNIKEQAIKFEDKRLEIKNAVINFFIENPDETLNSKDKIIVYDSNDNKIQIKPQQYKPSQSEQPIIIGDNTKLEILQKRFKKAQEKISRLESKNEELSISWLELQIELGQMSKVSKQDKERIIQLESKNRELSESLDKSLQKIEIALGIKEAEKSEVTVASLWLPKLDPSSDSNSPRKDPEAWLPPSISLEDRLHNCLQALQQKLNIQKSSEQDKATISRLESEKKKLIESLDETLQEFKIALGKNEKETEIELATLEEIIKIASEYLKSPDPRSESSSSLPKVKAIDVGTQTESASEELMQSREIKKTSTMRDISDWLPNPEKTPTKSVSTKSGLNWLSAYQSEEEREDSPRSKSGDTTRSALELLIATSEDTTKSAPKPTSALQLIEKAMERR
jgi:hypothetical protein